MHKIVFYRNHDMFATKGQIGRQVRAVSDGSRRKMGILGAVFRAFSRLWCLLQVKINCLSA